MSAAPVETSMSRPARLRDGDTAADASPDRWVDHMSRGDFEAAWRVSDVLRRSDPDAFNPRRPRHVQCVWDGRSVDGQRVLVRCYHGLGDTLQFIRYVPLLRTRAREVIVWAQPRLMPVLRNLSGIHRLLPLHDGTPPCEYDVDVEVMELPYLFRSTLATLPATVPYLRVERCAIDRSRGPAVGLFWRGGGWSPDRSIPFRQVRRLLDLPATWHLLQTDLTAEERQADGILCGDLTFSATASLIASVDLMISVDSMPAHLAGALGTRVWTLLPARADWRWMVDRNDSPWYPSMRLMRQEPGEDWDPLIDRVGDALRVWGGREGPPRDR
jgi:hypothetical protein